MWLVILVAVGVANKWYSFGNYDNYKVLYGFLNSYWVNFFSGVNYGVVLINVFWIAAGTVASDGMCIWKGTFNTIRMAAIKV